MNYAMWHDHPAATVHSWISRDTQICVTFFALRYWRFNWEGQNITDPEWVYKFCWVLQLGWIGINVIGPEREQS
jgi:hypothetical protein